MRLMLKHLWRDPLHPLPDPRDASKAGNANVVAPLLLRNEPAPDKRVYNPLVASRLVTPITHANGAAFDGTRRERLELDHS
jgi:hypothetical protein